MAVVFVASGNAALADIAGAPTRHPALADLLDASFAPVPKRLHPWVHRVLRAEINSYRPVASGAVRDQKLLPPRNVLVVSVEEFPEVAAAYDVTGLPAHLVIDAAGSIVARHEGKLAPAEWRAFLSCAAECAAGTCAALGAGTPSAVAPTAAAPAASAPVPVANMVTIPWTATQPPATAEPPAAVPTGRPAAPSSGSAPTLPGGRDRLETTGSFAARGDAERVLTRTFSAPGLWTIELETTRGDGDLDIEVLGPDDGKLEISEAASGDERIELAVQPGVAYKLRVYSFREVEQTLAWTLRERVEALAGDRHAPGALGEVVAEEEPVRVTVPGGGEAWLRFLPARQGRFRFAIGGAAGIEAVAVNSQGEILGRMEQSGVVVTTPERGRVHLRLASASGAARTVEVSVAQYTAVEPASVRGEVTIGRDATGRVGGDAGDQQIYRLRVANDGTYDLTLRGTGASAEGADIDLELLKGTGELIERSEGPAAAETIRRELVAGEEYFLRVYAYRAEEAVGFQVGVAVASGPLPRPGGDVVPPVSDEIRPPDTATLLPVARRVSDSVTQGQNRWFRILPAANGLIAVFLDGGDVDQDIDLAVHKADGERVEVSQTDSAREALLLKVQAGQPLFLRIFAYGSSAGAGYRIWYQVID